MARREATSRGRRIGLVVDGLAEPEDVGLDSTKHRGDGVAVLMGNVRDRTHARTAGNVHRMARRFNTPPGWPRPPSPEWLPGPGLAAGLVLARPTARMVVSDREKPSGQAQNFPPT